jgi:hypothetical protein
MKKTIKNKKQKKSINKRRRKSIKKTRGGDQIKIMAYNSLLDPKDTILYKIAPKRNFPEKTSDVVLFEPAREVEESIAEILKSINMNKESFKTYPVANATYINIDHPDKKFYPTITVQTPPAPPAPK